MKSLWLFAFSVAVTATSTSVSAQFIHKWSQVEAERVAGHQLFLTHCAACHVASGLAPNLVGVVGRPAGSLPGFPYSDALKKSGITWTEDNLHKWVADNKRMLPNTLMPHVSLSDPAEQLYIVEYLKTLKPPGH